MANDTKAERFPAWKNLDEPMTVDDWRRLHAEHIADKAQRTVASNAYTFAAMVEPSRPCPACADGGEFVENPCGVCGQPATTGAAKGRG